MDKLKGCLMGCAKVYVVLLLVGALSILLGDWFAVAFLIAIPTYFIVFNIRVYLYFNGQEFASMKSRISSHIKDCNDLNIHIGELKMQPLLSTAQTMALGSITMTASGMFTEI